MEECQPPSDEEFAHQFHLYPSIESLFDAAEEPAAEQQVDGLINELAERFKKCQQLLQQVPAGSHGKHATLKEQRAQLEKLNKQIQLRRELVEGYKQAVNQPNLRPPSA